MRITGGIEMKEADMRRAIVFLGLLLLCDAARAQDIPGMELCTHETKMDRRTGCLQSNTEYLHQLIRKNAAEAQKLAVANNEITALKSALAGLQVTMARLQAAQEKSQEKPPEKK
jgi:hypothetical protein